MAGRTVVSLLSGSPLSSSNRQRAQPRQPARRCASSFREAKYLERSHAQLAASRALPRGRQLSLRGSVARWARAAATGDAAVVPSTAGDAAGAAAAASEPAVVPEVKIERLGGGELLFKSVGLSWRSLRALLIVSAGASVAEQVISFLTFAIILVTGAFRRTSARRIALMQ